MRHQWYGDGRDLIKWAVLIHLATTRNLKQIVDAVYLRPDAPRPLIKSRRKPIPFSGSVWAHFRDIHDIRRLAAATGIDIKVIGTPFDAKARSRYTQEVLEAFCADSRRPMLVFLDPDTGIAERNAKSEHVTSAEVGDIWRTLPRFDWLVLYQHANRRKGWVARKRAEFQRAIDSSHVETFRARRGATDVAFYCAVKQ